MHLRVPPPSRNRPAAAHSYSALPLSQDVLTAAVESGIDTLLLPEAQQQLAADWAPLARFSSLCYAPAGDVRDTATGEHVGVLRKLSSVEGLRRTEADAAGSGFVVMDATDWQVGGPAAVCVWVGGGGGLASLNMRV